MLKFKNKICCLDLHICYTLVSRKHSFTTDFPYEPEYSAKTLK